MPSLSETFGFPILEAMALSRPLDALAEGEETARGLGLRVRFATGMVVAAASLGTAAAVATTPTAVAWATTPAACRPAR